ncbi:acyltransferase [Heyndrickxia coagulans]|uniref:acyltransferase n=1 Tax=Heyndrickxia coagulans TaxID=1398 RepID=UPI002E1CD9B6|nr:acyltransferase [Heyndrickxia coagulans]
MKLLYKIIKSLIFLSNYIVNTIILKIFKVEYHTSAKINGRIFIRNKGKIYIGKNVKVNSSFISNPITGDTKTVLFTCAEDAEIIIKENVGISNSVLHSKSKIIINEDVFIGCGCKIYDHDFHSININDRLSEIQGKPSNEKTKPVNIGRGAFIGANSVILKGVTIGENAVIGAGSVVASSVPKGEVWAGNPARFVKKL